MQIRSVFARSLPDLITDELVLVLVQKPVSMAFREIFVLAYSTLRHNDAVRGGEEAVRLRCYEKLQGLVSLGAVKKIEKKYKGITTRLQPLVKPRPKFKPKPPKKKNLFPSKLVVNAPSKPLSKQPAKPVVKAKVKPPTTAKPAAHPKIR